MRSRKQVATRTFMAASTICLAVWMCGCSDDSGTKQTNDNTGGNGDVGGTGGENGNVGGSGGSGGSPQYECVIEGVHYALEDKNPANSCEACMMSSATAWTATPGLPCNQNGGSFCNSSGECEKSVSISAITAGLEFTCVLTSAGDSPTGGAKCWGENDVGQLGDGTSKFKLVPTQVSGLTSGVRAISANGYHACAIVTDGSTASGGVKCWGENEDGQLGDGTTVEKHTPTQVTGLSANVIQISAGGRHVCALVSSGGGTTGGVKCWGANENGQLGDGTNTDRHTPTQVSGLESGVTAIASGHILTCALTSSGGVLCWGSNYRGALGNGTGVDSPVPTAVPGLESGVLAIAAGSSHACAIVSPGNLYCWGDNGYGQLGDGTNSFGSVVPILVPTLDSNIIAVAAHKRETCAIESAGSPTSGAVKCWGDNTDERLGIGATDGTIPPTLVAAVPPNVTAITVGQTHACALISAEGSTGARAMCWGSNAAGELGDGTLDSHTTPVQVIGIK